MGRNITNMYTNANKDIKKTITCDKAAESATKDEVCSIAVLAANMKLMQELYAWSKKQSRGGKILAGLLSILGVIDILVAILMVGNDSDTKQIVLCVFASVLLVVLAGVVIWMYRPSFAQVEMYHIALHENEQFWTIVSLIDKVQNMENNADKELYMRVIESEIRNREKLYFSRRKES